MNKLHINRPNLREVASLTHQPSALDKSWLTNGSRTRAVRAEVPQAERFNNFSGSQLSSRPSSGYFSHSQQSSQPTFTESQINLSQNSIQSDPGIHSNLLRCGSRGRDFSNKRPRSPNRPAVPLYFRNNVKDGASILPITPTPTALSPTRALLQRTPDTSREKCLLTEMMEQRLTAFDNCLNGIFGGLDGLQKNLYYVQASVKEAALESEVNRQKEAVRQHLLQTLVDQVEENRRNFVIFKTIPDTVRDEMKKLQTELSKAVKTIPDQIAEQITEMKAELLKTVRKEFQVAISKLKRTEPRSLLSARRLSSNNNGECEDTPESCQGRPIVPCTRRSDLVSQKLLKGPSAKYKEPTQTGICKDDYRSKRPLRGKRSTRSPLRSTSNYRTSKENIRDGDPGDEGKGYVETKANLSGRHQDTPAVSGASEFRSQDARSKRISNKMPPEAGWITVRRAHDENRSSSPKAHISSETFLTNPKRHVPPHALLQKASNSEVQCDPVAQLTNKEDDEFNSLVYVDSRAADPENNYKPETISTKIVELSHIALDETRLISQRLKARRRRFHCL